MVPLLVIDVIGSTYIDPRHLKMLFTFFYHTSAASISSSVGIVFISNGNKEFAVGLLFGADTCFATVLAHLII